MTTLLRMQMGLIDAVRGDLRRPHRFAAERVGFLACRAARLSARGLMILATDYRPVADDDYVKDRTVGAMMGPRAIRLAMQLALNGGQEDISIFHIHMHDWVGYPGFSRIDLTESAKFVPPFFNVAPAMPHGIIVLSRDRAAGLCWRAPGLRPQPIDRFSIVGAPLRFWEWA
jgi:hypothetical protein